jgi:hypothetical protein
MMMLYEINTSEVMQMSTAATCAQRRRISLQNLNNHET